MTLWDNVDQLNRDRGVGPEDPDRPYQQLWFPGDHSSVGGGNNTRGLSDEGLEWVLEGAKRQGLALDTAAYSKIWAIRPNVLASTESSALKSWSPAAVIMRNLPKADRTGPVDVSTHARELLAEASASKSGHILVVRHLGGTRLQANGKSFGVDNDRRSIARWEAAIQELANHGFIEDTGRGEVFRVTDSGFRYVDAHVIEKNKISDLG